MKLNRFTLFLFIGIMLMYATSGRAQFSNTYGDANANLTTRIKTYNGVVYVAGARLTNGVRHATFSRLQANGTPDWTVELGEESNPLDFEIITTEAGGPPVGFFLVGHDGTLANGNDSRSFITRITPLGTVQWTRFYNNSNRREVFRRVLRRPIGLDAGEEYFVLGVINHDSIGAADTWDRGWLLRMNGDGDILSSQLYHYEPTQGSNTDSELGSTIIIWDATNNLIAGNVYDGSSFGVVYTVHRQTGAVGQSWKLPDGVVITDIYRMSMAEGSDLIISGIISGTVSFVARINSTDFSTRWWYRMSGMTSLNHIGSDGQGNLFLTGTESANGADPVVLRLSQNATSATLTDVKRIIVTGDANLQQPQLWMRPGMSSLLYADSRNKGNSWGFGDLDMHIGAYGPTFDSTYSCFVDVPKTLVADNTTLELQTVTNMALAIPPPVESAGCQLTYSHQSDMCGGDTNLACCSAIQALPSGENCNCARLVFGTDEIGCMPPKIGVSVTGGATIDEVQVFYADCTTQTLNVDASNTNFPPTSGCQITQIIACLNSGFTSPATLTWQLFYGGTPEDCTFEQVINCGPPTDVCCPDISVKPCLCTPGSGNINYEVHVDIAGSGSVCQLTDFSISGISYTSVGSVYIDSDPVMPGSTFWPSAGSGTFPWNSIALNGSGAIDDELVFVINLPINFTGSMTFNSVSCDGSICSFSVPIENDEESGIIEMTAVPFEDSLFAMKLRIKPDLISDSLKLRYISLATVCCGDAATGSTNPDQPDIFALTGAVNPSEPSAANNFQFKSASMGKHSAHFELLQPLSLANFPQDVYLHLVTTQKVDSLFVAFFDENGALITTTNLVNPAQQEIVAVDNPNALQGDISLSPNPAVDESKLVFSLAATQQVTIELLDLTGKQIWEKDLGLCFKGQQQQLTIHTSDFPEGTYLLRIKSEKGTSAIRRLVVMR